MGRPRVDGGTAIPEDSNNSPCALQGKPVAGDISVAVGWGGIVLGLELRR